MALENLKENVAMGKRLVGEIMNLSSQLYVLENAGGRESEEELVKKSLNYIIKRLEIVNNSIPSILESISEFRKLQEDKEKEKEVKELVRISHDDGRRRERTSVTISKNQRYEYTKSLRISTETLKRLKKRGESEGIKKSYVTFRKTNWYAKISNRLFLKISTKYADEGKLKRLNANLRKANLYILVTTYLSIILFSTVLTFLLGLIIFASLLLVSTELLFVLRNLLIVVFLPILAFLFLYYYPYFEARSTGTKIDRELPFITIHMSAIAGSGIEPSQIFRIVATGSEYPNTKKEFKKIINQVNVYGYDLITSLKNVSRETSSSRLSELLNGIATTISGGGSLSDFLDKRAETLLFDYRLERERKTKSAETFMDIYISIVIAAPMILTLLLVLIAISGISIGLSLDQLTLVIISVVSLINIIFLVFLHLSQPGY